MLVESLTNKLVVRGGAFAYLTKPVAVEELLRRVPEFSVAGPVTWSEGTVRGPRRLPLRFG